MSLSVTNLMGGSGMKQPTNSSIEYKRSANGTLKAPMFVEGSVSATLQAWEAQSTFRHIPSVMITNGVDEFYTFGRYSSSAMIGSYHKIDANGNKVKNYTNTYLGSTSIDPYNFDAVMVSDDIALVVYTVSSSLYGILAQINHETGAITEVCNSTYLRIGGGINYVAKIGNNRAIVFTASSTTKYAIIDYSTFTSLSSISDGTIASSCDSMNHSYDYYEKMAVIEMGNNKFAVPIYFCQYKIVTVNGTSVTVSDDTITFSNLKTRCFTGVKSTNVAYFLYASGTSLYYTTISISGNTITQGNSVLIATYSSGSYASAFGVHDVENNLLSIVMNAGTTSSQNRFAIVFDIANSRILYTSDTTISYVNYSQRQSSYNIAGNYMLYNIGSSSTAYIYIIPCGAVASVKESTSSIGGLLVDNIDENTYGKVYVLESE